MIDVSLMDADTQAGNPNLSFSVELRSESHQPLEKPVNKGMKRGTSTHP
jgi:hypothetical protein